MGTNKLNVFVSYSRHDRQWLELVHDHLKPLTRGGKLDLWEDSEIKPGAPWHEELKAALNRANVAVLLLSAKYFASDFIVKHELPLLLEAQRERGLVILGVHITRSRFDREALADYQTVNPSSEPLAGLDGAKRHEVLDRLARQIEELLERQHNSGSISQRQALVKKIEERLARQPPTSQAAIAELGNPIRFPYVDQFTSQPLLLRSPPDIIVFDYSRAPPLDQEIWEHDVISPHDLFSEWFHENEELKELGEEWGVLLDEEVHRWKGTQPPLDVEGHPYLKSMCPFIAVSRMDRRELRGIDDPRSHVVLLFLTWVRKLCKIDTKSEFILHDLVVSDKYMYLDGDFIFRNIAISGTDKRLRSNNRYKLDRKLIVVDYGQKIYTVSTGVPYPAGAGSDYTIHVHRWLSDFQLGRR